MLHDFDPSIIDDVKKRKIESPDFSEEIPEIKTPTPDREEITVFVTTIAKENEYHDHDVIGVYRTKLIAQHSLLISDEMKEMCQDLDKSDPLYLDYSNYMLQKHTFKFITEACSKLYKALTERFQSIEDCFYWFHIVEHILHND